MRILAPAAAVASPRYTPVEVARLAAVAGGVELVGTGRQVALGALRLVSVLAAEVEGREEILLLLFIAEEERPFLIPGHGIAYAGFPARRGYSVVESLRHFIDYLVAEVPTLAVARHTHDYLRGGRPLEVDEESLPGLISGLAIALANASTADADPTVAARSSPSPAAGTSVCRKCGLKHAWPDACPRCGTPVGAKAPRTADDASGPPSVPTQAPAPAPSLPPTAAAVPVSPVPVIPAKAKAKTPVPAPTPASLAVPAPAPKRPAPAPQPFLIQAAQPSEAKLAIALILAAAAVGLLRGVLLWGGYETLRPSTLYLVLAFFLPAAATVAVALGLRAGAAWAYPTFLLLALCGLGGLASLRAEYLQGFLAGLGGPLQALITAAAALLLATSAVDRWLAARAGGGKGRRLEIEPAGLLRGAIIAPLVLPVLAFLYIGVVGEERALIPPDGMARAIVWMILVGVPITYVLVWQGLIPALLLLRHRQLDRAGIVLLLGLFGGLFVVLLARGGHLPLSSAMVPATSWPFALLAGFSVAGLTWNSHTHGRGHRGAKFERKAGSGK